MRTAREINLLPPQLLTQRLYRIYLQRLGRPLRGTIGGLGLLLVVLAAAYGVVVVTERISTRHVSGLAESDASVGQMIEQVNRELGAVKRWRNQHAAWTVLLPDVLGVLPPDVRLTALSVDGSDDALTIRGIFSSRESVVVLQRRLEELPWVTSLDAPLSNFQTGADATFSFTLHR